MYTLDVEIGNTYNIKSTHIQNFTHFELFLKSHIINLNLNNNISYINPEHAIDSYVFFNIIIQQ